MALASNALATVADFNGDTGNSTTATAERFINAASDAIERYLDRSLQYATGLTQTLAPTGGTRLMVDRTPLRAITSIVTVDSATIDATSYAIEGDGEAGFIYCNAGWLWTANTMSAMEPYQKPGTERPFYVITYAAGYSLPAQTQTYPLPVSITEACLITAAAMYARRGKQDDIAAEAVGNASVSYGFNVVTGRNVIPATAMQLLAPFKRLGT